MSYTNNSLEKKSMSKCKILIVVSRFNEAISMPLLKAANRCLEQNGIDLENVKVIEVPGALEIPIALKIELAKKKYTAAIALGAVIRGATPHFDFVAKESIAGVMKVSLETGIVIPIGILTTDTAEQALERIGIKYSNKGWDAAQTVVDMINVLGLSF